MDYIGGRGDYDGGRGFILYFILYLVFDDEI